MKDKLKSQSIGVALVISITSLYATSWFAFQPASWWQAPSLILCFLLMILFAVVAVSLALGGPTE